MAEKRDFDLAVIGAGPAGYVAAIRASQLGLSACVVEKEKPGGVCLNIGCIPSKAIIHQASNFLGASDLESIGVTIDRSTLDYERVFKKSRKAADTLSKGVSFLLKKNSVELISGSGAVIGPNEVAVDEKRTISANHIMLATGSRPIELSDFPVDEKIVLTSNGALMLTKLPKKLIILGGGYIGCEFAYAMSAFGVEVIVVEMLEHILPMEDPEIAEQLAKSFKKQGISIHASTRASGMKKTGSTLELTLEPISGGKSTVTADALLVVVGRRPNTENLGLEKVGIKTEKGYVNVGDYYQTNVPSIYAVGDIVRSPALAHVASKEAEIAVEHIAGRRTETRIDPDLIPAAVYTEPQVASFGVDEARAKERGLKFETASFPYRGAGKSVAVEHPDGMVKLVVAPESSEILGAQIVGANATELIHEILLAKKAELLPEDIATMIHAHPTLSEAVMEAHRAAEGWAIHV